jgi:chromosome segregation ATPase
MADDVNIQQAMAELGKMAGFAKAFRDVEIVLNALANAEQVGKELAAANDAARADLEGTKALITAAQAEADQILTKAHNVLFKAEEQADADLAAAHELIEADKAKAADELAALDEEVAKRKQALTDLAAATTQQSAELDALEAKVTEAKAFLDRIKAVN